MIVAMMPSRIQAPTAAPNDSGGGNCRLIQIVASTEMMSGPANAMNLMRRAAHGRPSQRLSLFSGLTV